MKSIPVKIKIYGHWYDVIHKKGFIDNKDWGQAELYKLKIKIDKNTTLQRKISTLLHETIEAINHDNKIELNHSNICVLEFFLLCLFNDNKLRFDKNISYLSSVKIGGYQYQIILEDEFINSKVYFQMNTETQILRILNDISISRKWTSFLIAIIDNLDNECEMDMPEGASNIIGEGIYLVMTENNIDFRHEGRP